MTQKMSKFTEIIGTSPESKVLEYFLEWGGEVDVNITDIVRASRVGRARAYGIIDKFSKKGIIHPTRKVGASQLYKLNLNSDVVKKSRELFRTILRTSARKEIAG